jgi:putative membrane protein (TIGR04086 family)
MGGPPSTDDSGGPVMSIGAILRGAAAGAVVALVLATLFAGVAYHTAVPSRAVKVALVAGDGMVSLVAGWVAARRAPSGAALSGMLAAVTLSVVALAAGTWMAWPMGSAWGQLALAAVLGLSGGLAAVMF